MIQRMGAYGICIDKRGAILLSRYGPPDGRWGLPGGGVEHGEHPEDAVVREVSEETGYAVRVERLLAVESGTWTTADRLSIHSVNFLYLVELIGGDLAFEVDGSSDMAAWIPLSDVDELSHTPIVDHALKRLDDVARHWKRWARSLPGH
jgi:8-oxo-dGTP diphosphatase